VITPPDILAFTRLVSRWWRLLHGTGKTVADIDATIRNKQTESSRAVATRTRNLTVTQLRQHVWLPPPPTSTCTVHIEVTVRTARVLWEQRLIICTLPIGSRGVIPVTVMQMGRLQTTRVETQTTEHREDDRMQWRSTTGLSYNDLLCVVSLCVSIGPASRTLWTAHSHWATLFVPRCTTMVCIHFVIIYHI
jgi:hypothetical protein